MSAKSHMSTLSCPLNLVEAEGENGQIQYENVDLAKPETSPSWIGQLYRVSSLGRAVFSINYSFL